MQPPTQPGAPPPPSNGEFDPAAGWLNDRPFHVSPNKKRVSRAIGASIVAHLLILLLMIAVLTVPGVSDMIQEQAPKVVYVFTPGPGGGGGGGGSNTPDPPQKVELEVPKPPVTKPTPEPTPVVPQLPVPVLPPITTQAPVTVPGTFSTLSAPASQGSGTGGGAGTGRGTGSGEGRGSGVGPGEGGGTGGGRYRPGGLVTDPEVLFERKPAYTAEAMRAKIQGEVEIEGVVMPDGTLTDLRIVRSLDKVYGLDQKALEAVRQWKFKPGRLKSTGEPVPIIVTIALTFTLR